MKRLLLLFYLTCPYSVHAEWVAYSNRSNGDVYFFDKERVTQVGDEVSVWTRVRYKTSVMAASSYQSFIKLNCSSNSETILQSTYFIDKDWSKPAMATNTHVKPAKQIEENSATEMLMRILCKD